MRPSAIFLSTLPFLAVSSPTPQQSHQGDWPSLSSLLARVDNSVLHSVLHQLSPKYQDGVFDQDRRALEEVHSSDPVVATKLVHMALKRQNNDTTTDDPTTSEPPTTTPTTTAVVDPTTTPSTTASTPPADSTTPSSSAATTPADSSQASQAASQESSQQASISSQLSEDITATTSPDPTTVAVAPSTPENATPVTTINGGVVFSTIGGGVVTETSRNVAVSFKPSSSTRLITSTLPNGQVETLTSVVVVNAPQTADAGDAAGAAATTGGPGLQNPAGAVEVNSPAVWFAAIAAAGIAGAAFAL